MTDVIHFHQLLRPLHAIIRSAADNPRRHHIASPNMTHLAPIRPGECAHEIPFGDDANHVSGPVANGHCANIVGAQLGSDDFQKVIRQASDQLLA
jgi:hypothetical protein